MRRDEVEAAVLGIVRTVLNLTETPSPALRRAQLPQWDSLRHVELMFALEDAFGVQFSSEELTTIDSVPAIVTALTEKERAA